MATLGTSLNSIYLTPGTCLVTLGYVPDDVTINNDPEGSLVVGTVAKTVDTPIYPVGWIVVYRKEHRDQVIINNIQYWQINESDVRFAIQPLV